MKKILILAVASVLGISALTSCEKEKTPIDVTKNAFLLERAWKVKAINFTANADAETPAWNDVFTILEPCKKDDYYYFTTLNTGNKHDYFVKCNVSDPDQFEFFYTVTENDTRISLYTNPDDPGASTLFYGIMETPNINEFKITNKYFNGASELNEAYEYVFEMTVPTDL